jgi:hypothetical protein
MSTVLFGFSVAAAIAFSLASILVEHCRMPEDDCRSDASALAGANGGVFSFEHVYAAIDGRLGILVHGTREMPVWGMAGRVSPALYRARTWAIIDYLATLQGK